MTDVDTILNEFNDDLPRTDLNNESLSTPMLHKELRARVNGHDVDRSLNSQRIDDDVVY